MRLMRALQGLKAPHTLVVLSVLMFSASLVLYCFSNQAEVNGRSRLRRDQSDSEGRKLEKVLKRASMPDRTVILTILNQEWASPGSVFDLFLEGFRNGQRTKSLLNHLVILTVDGQAFQYCSSKHPHCFDLATYRINFATWKLFKNLHHLKLGRRKIELLGEVLDLGYNLVFTDADVMWFRNPFPHFEPGFQINIASDFYADDLQSKSNRADGGFFYLKSDAISVEFFKYWKMARLFHPNASDDFIFEIIKDDTITRMLGLEIKYLDTDYFGSFCQSRKDMSKLCTMHAECYNSIDRKVHHLRLILDVWRNSTVHSSQKMV